MSQMKNTAYSVQLPYIKGLHYLRLKASTKRKIEYMNPVHLRKIRGAGLTPSMVSCEIKFTYFIFKKQNDLT